MSIKKSCFITVLFMFVLTSCRDQKTASYLGYIEGDYIRINSPAMGKIKDLFIQAGAQVSKEAKLFSVELPNVSNNHKNNKQSIKEITAPINGLVVDILYSVGEQVSVDHPVIILLPPENIKLRFYLPEYDFSHVKIGQKVTIRCDNCLEVYQASIDYIAAEPEYTPPMFYSVKSRAKFVYLIEAQFDTTKTPNLNPGQPVDVTLN